MSHRGDGGLRVLVVNQRMDRTGAPRQLATLLGGLAGRGLHVTLLAGSDGPLSEELAPQVRRSVREPWPLRALARLARDAPPWWAHRLDRAWIAAMRRLAGRVDVVYVNSLISTRLARPFAHLPTVVHVHELAGAADSYGEPARQLVAGAVAVLVPSEPARSWVLDRGVPPERVIVVPGALPPSSFRAPADDEVAALRARLGLRPADLVVATVGWVGLPKGSDRFLEVAARVGARLDGRVRFLWVGGGAGTGEERRLAATAADRGLDGIVRLLPGMDDLRPLYRLADLLLITSREESLSLVALEAAALGTPVVSFPGAGGPDALAAEGVVTQPTGPDVAGVADVVHELLVDEARRRGAGSAALAAVKAGHGAERSQRMLLDVLASAAGREDER